MTQETRKTVTKIEIEDTRTETCSREEPCPSRPASEKHWSKFLVVWRAQLLAMAAAPFLGIGFLFNFSLQAKDFPELASAMWGVTWMCVGLFLSILCLLLAIMAIWLVGEVKSTKSSSGWSQQIVVWIVTILSIGAGAVFLYSAYLAFSGSQTNFKSFVAPYVQWLRENTHQTP